MKNLIKLTTLIFSISLFIACQTTNQSEEVSLLAPISMDDGETVIYTFNYPDDIIVNHSIIKLYDANPYGEIISGLETGTTQNYMLDEVSNNTELSNEESFLFLSTNLTQTGVSTITPPLEFETPVCTNQMLKIGAGEFFAQECICQSIDKNISYTTYTHLNEKKPTPLNGLLKYEWSNGSDVIVVELNYWDGL